MGEGLPPFLKVYKGLASEELIEKSVVWYEKTRESHFCRYSLKTRREYRQKDFRKFRDFGGEAYDLILSLDILGRCVGSISAYSGVCLIERSAGGYSPDDSPTRHNHVKAVFSLSSYIFEMISAAWRLIFAEHDVALRLICRSALEASDYLLAVQNDRSLAEKYVISGEEFNRPWYDRLRSDKLVKLRKDALREFFNGDEALVQEISDYRDVGASDFSMAVHPSYDAGVMSILGKRSYFPDEPEWDFMSRWAHIRAAVFLIDCCSLPVSIELIRLPFDGRSSQEKPTLPFLEKKKISLGREGVTALLHGVMLSSSCAAAHHQRYPTP